MPEMSFPGGLLIGCDAGTLNAAKIKGSHTAMQSGILAADSIFAALVSEPSVEKVTDFSRRFRESALHKELYKARNFSAGFHKFGFWLGSALSFIEQNNTNDESILINSNFDCGYYLDRGKLFNILQYEYKLNTSYDACTYPGVRCKFYYSSGCILNGTQKKETDKSISFMVFRTGSVLIVGKCNENELISIYKYIKNILIIEHSRIVVETTEKKKKEHLEKKVKKTITIIKNTN